MAERGEQNDASRTWPDAGRDPGATLLSGWTGLIGRAAEYARVLHAGDVRKGSERPYFDAHLVEVAVLVAAAGGDEIQVAAAFLHDAAEDHGGHRQLEAIRVRFADHPRVEDLVRIVSDLSDSLVDTESGAPKQAWRARKQAYLASLPMKSEQSLLVAAADKLHNATAILTDLRALGPALWSRFSTSDPADHLWYYGRLADTLEAALAGSPLVDGLRATVTAIAEEVEAADREVPAP